MAGGYSQDWMTGAAMLQKTLCFAAAWVLLAVACVQASLLIGTSSIPTDDLVQVQAMIAEYNLTHADLPNAVSFIDKLEARGAETELLGLDCFAFYKPGTTGAAAQVFDASLKLEGTTVGLHHRWPDEPVLVFDFTPPTSGQTFDYYVSKNGDGWSLWYFTADPSPVYADDTSDGPTIGESTTDTTLAYDPVMRGVSHISFYSASPVPEPNTAAICMVLCGVAIGLACWRQKPAAEAAGR